MTLLPGHADAMVGSAAVASCVLIGTWASFHGVINYEALMQ